MRVDRKDTIGSQQQVPGFVEQLVQFLAIFFDFAQEKTYLEVFVLTEPESRRKKGLDLFLEWESFFVKVADVYSPQVGSSKCE